MTSLNSGKCPATAELPQLLPEKAALVNK